MSLECYDLVAFLNVVLRYFPLVVHPVFLISDSARALAISKALYITSHYEYKASEPLAILLTHIIGVLFVTKAGIALIAKHRNILDRGGPRGRPYIPTPSNRQGRARFLSRSRRVKTLEIPTDYNHVGSKLLIHVESLIWFVHGFITSGLNSGTMTDRAKGS